MAYPPSPPALGKVNTTPQVDDHPAHHNALASAIGDLIDHLGDVDDDIDVLTNAAGMPSANDWKLRRVYKGVGPARVIVDHSTIVGEEVRAWPDMWSNGLIYQNGTLYCFQLGLQITAGPTYKYGCIRSRVIGDNWLVDPYTVRDSDFVGFPIDDYTCGGGPLLETTGTKFGMVLHMEGKPGDFENDSTFGIARFASAQDLAPVYLGELIRSQAPSSVGVAGIGPGTIVRHGDYVLLYYDETPYPGPPTSYQTVARCSYSSWVSSIDSGTVPPFLKWDGSAFTEDPITGVGAPLPNDVHFVGDVVRMRNGLLLSVNRNGTGWAGDANYRISDDGITWSDEKVISTRYDDMADNSWYSFTIYSGNPTSPRIVDEGPWQLIVSDHDTDVNRWDTVRLARVDVHPFDVDPELVIPDVSAILADISDIQDTLDTLPVHQDSLDAHNQRITVLSKTYGSFPTLSTDVGSDVSTGDPLDVSSDLNPVGGISIVFDTVSDDGNTSAAGWSPTPPFTGAMLRGAKLSGFVVTDDPGRNVVVAAVLVETGSGSPVTGWGGSVPQEVNWSNVPTMALVVGNVPFSSADPLDVYLAADEPVDPTGTLLVVASQFSGSTPTVPPVSIVISKIEWLWDTASVVPLL